MSAHVATRLAWSLWALAVVPGGAALAVSSYLGGRAGLDPAELAVRVATLLLLLPLLAFATVGALVASRRPEQVRRWCYAFRPGSTTWRSSAPATCGAALPPTGRSGCWPGSRGKSRPALERRSGLGT